VQSKPANEASPHQDPSTPVATSVATPVATPVATLVATPVATSVATPTGTSVSGAPDWSAGSIAREGDDSESCAHVSVPADGGDDVWAEGGVM